MKSTIHELASPAQKSTNLFQKNSSPHDLYNKTLMLRCIVTCDNFSFNRKRNEEQTLIWRSKVWPNIKIRCSLEVKSFESRCLQLLSEFVIHSNFCQGTVMYLFWFWRENIWSKIGSYTKEHVSLSERKGHDL